MNNNSKLRKIISIGLLLITLVIFGLIINYYRVNQWFPVFTPTTIGSEKYFFRFWHRFDTAQINIDSEGLMPNYIIIGLGGKITWTNIDDVPHRLVSDPFIEGDSENVGDFDSDALEPGETFTLTFNTKGTFTYHDYDNPLKIKGTIDVR